MAIPRNGKPYVWTTWLSRLMVGENSCEWAPWFKSHHEGWSWEKVRPSGSELNDLAGWQMRHTRGIAHYRGELEQQGFEVLVEGQNSFRLAGQTAVLGGRPDLIGLKDGMGRIVDVKTGRPRQSHIAQLTIYLYAVSRVLEQYRGVDMEGAVVYPTHTVRVFPESVDGRFIVALGDLVRRISSSLPARRVPSLSECRFCELPQEECPEKVFGPEPVPVMATQDF